MTARTAAIIFLLFLASLAIQGSVLAMAAPGGVHPDILLVVTVALSALAGPRRDHNRPVCGTDAGYSFRFTPRVFCCCQDAGRSGGRLVCRIYIQRCGSGSDADGGRAYLFFRCCHLFNAGRLWLLTPSFSGWLPAAGNFHPCRHQLFSDGGNLPLFVPRAKASFAVYQLPPD